MATIETPGIEKYSRRSAGNNNSKPSVPSNKKMEPTAMDNFLAEISGEKSTFFSFHRVRQITSNFSKELGSGNFGIVYEGRLEDGTAVAVKVLKCNISDTLIEKQFKAEVQSLGRTHHFNLVRLHGFCFEEDLKALIYEFMENGSLDRFLLPDQQTRIEWDKLHDIAVGTAKGIAYLHEDCLDRIIHYDIKPQNILLDANFNPKVSDLGLAKLCSRDASHVTKSGFRGTIGYAAPETCLPYPVTHKCDVYSFGILLFNILVRRNNLIAITPWREEWLPMQIWKKFDEGCLREMVGELGIEEKDREKAERMAIIAFWCVQYQPGLRPSMSSVVKMLEGELKFDDQPPYPFPGMVPFDGSENFAFINGDGSSNTSNCTIWMTPLTR